MNVTICFSYAIILLWTTPSCILYVAEPWWFHALIKCTLPIFFVDIQRSCSFLTVSIVFSVFVDVIGSLCIVLFVTCTVSSLLAYLEKNAFDLWYFHMVVLIITVSLETSESCFGYIFFQYFVVKQDSCSPYTVIPIVTFWILKLLTWI